MSLIIIPLFSFLLLRTQSTGFELTLSLFFFLSLSLHHCKNDHIWSRTNNGLFVRLFTREPRWCPLWHHQVQGVNAKPLPVTEPHLCGSEEPGGSVGCRPLTSHVESVGFTVTSKDQNLMSAAEGWKQTCSSSGSSAIPDVPRCSSFQLKAAQTCCTCELKRKTEQRRI